MLNLIGSYFVSGGPVMYPIAVLSVLGLASFMERSWSMRDKEIGSTSFENEFFPFWNKLDCWMPKPCVESLVASLRVYSI